MYAADPFVAQQEVKERQAKAAQKKAVTNSVQNETSSSGPYKDSPEVRMATSLREKVEEAIKEVNFSSFTFDIPVLDKGL
jgi:hypothetical protein